MAGFVQSEDNSVVSIIGATSKSAWVFLKTLLSGENQALNRIMTTGSYSFVRYATNQTATVVKTGAGIFHGITVNTKGTVASTITVWDNTAGSGTVICTIDSLNLSGSFLYDAAVGTGITVTSTGTAAPDFTVLYL